MIIIWIFISQQEQTWEADAVQLVNILTKAFIILSLSDGFWLKSITHITRCSLSPSVSANIL